MQKLLFALLSVLAIGAAVDLQIQNTFISFAANQNANEYIAVKNLNSVTTVSSVSYTITPEDSNVLIGYPNGASNSTVGSIQHGATGYGTFYAVGNAGVYNATVYFTYKKGTTTYHQTNTVILDVYSEDDDGGIGKKDAEEDNEVAIVNAAEHTLDARTPAIYSLDTGFVTDDSVATWVGFHSKTGSNALNSVTYTVAPDSTSVIIVYPSGTGNSLGSIAANTEKDTSFEIDGPYGEYNLNITYRYKIGSGSFQTLSYSIPLNIVCDSCGDGIGRREYIAVNEVVVAEKQPFQFVYVAAAGAGVAVVAVVAIVGTLLFRRRSTTETVSA